MYVILQSYNETNQERQKELAFCLRYLLLNPYVTQIIDLSELDTIPQMYTEAVRHHPEKYRFIGNNEWMTYHNAMQFALKHIPKDEVVALINNDIFFGKNQDWSQVNTLLQTLQTAHGIPVIFTLTRHEWGGTESTSTLDPSFVRSMGSNSQDAWIWLNGSIKLSDNYQIPMGIMGCDNAFAHRLFHYNSVIPYNVGDKWKVFHYDKCRHKTGSNSKQWHATNQKQASQGHETEGNLVVPFLSKIPELRKRMTFLRNHETEINTIKQFSKQYIVILKLLEKNIQIRN